jgi:hypothetical protein
MTRWQIRDQSGNPITGFGVEAVTAKGAVQKIREEKGHTDSYYDDLYQIKEVWGNFDIRLA